MSAYEVTVYVNPGVDATPDGIRFIQPYAAYDVSSDEWTVVPEPEPVIPANPSWDAVVERDRMAAETIVRHYLRTIDKLRTVTNPAYRANAESQLRNILDSASGLYDEIHHGRSAAFGPAGGGYHSFGNYRWQKGKATGAVPALRRLRGYWKDSQESLSEETYGVTLPDSTTLYRRAATYRQAR